MSATVAGKIPGYVDYGFDAVVKFGGSLLIDAGLTANAIAAVELTQKSGRRVLVVPGGGPTDKAIEAIDQRHSLAPDTHHRACARAQDQTGLMICDPAFSRILTPCETLEEARKVVDADRIPVMLPAQIIFAVDPFERSWDITSDGIALWFAWLVSAPLAMILTNVDGIFKPGTDFAQGEVIQRVAASTLCGWGHTAVDKCVPQFALRKGVRVWVGHGGYPARLNDALLAQPTIGTFIDPN